MTSELKAGIELTEVEVEALRCLVLKPSEPTGLRVPYRKSELSRYMNTYDDMPEWAKLTAEELGTFCVVCQAVVPLGAEHPRHSTAEIVCAYRTLPGVYFDLSPPHYPMCRCVTELPGGLVEQAHALVGDIDVDLDAPIKGDVAI